MNYCGIEFKWELNREEKEVIKYLIENDFVISTVKQYISKIKLFVEKDNVSIPCEIPSNIYDVEGFIESFDKSFDLAKRLTYSNDMKEKGER